MAIPTTPTPETAEWLKENFKKYKNAELAARFNVPEYAISTWFKALGLKKLNRVSGHKKESRQIKWLSNEYSNQTREQHVNRILNMQL